MNNQKGFGVVEVILILIIVGIIGFTGWRVYEANKEISQSPVENSTIKKETQLNDTEDIARTRHLEVPEMGVKIKLTDDIKDAYYETYSDKAVSLKTKSLDSYGDCKENQLSVVALIKVGKDEIDPMTDKKFSVNGSGVVVGESYYYIQGAQYACVDDDQAQLAILSKVRAAFVDAAKSIEQL